MALPKNKAWFPAKTYGWGWGLPCRWQGWAVLIAFIGAIVAGVPLTKKGSLVFGGYCFALLVGFVVIGLWKGEKPHWSWRKPD